MKTLISCAFFLVFSVCPALASAGTPAYLHTRPVSSFSFFRAHRQGPGTSLSWATAATGVAQFLVERSYDGEFFDVVGAVICEGGKTHKFADNGVYPGVIFYRITAVSAGGNTETSEVVSVRIVRHG
jgi:hypothetical protein